MTTTTRTLTIDVANLSGADRAPLFCQHAGQLRPQPAYIELTEDGTVRANYSGEASGTPMSVAHGRDLQWAIDPQVSASTLRRLLADGSQLVQLLGQVHAGHSVEWDGSNHRGRLTDAAEAASDQIERLLEDLDPSDDMANVTRADEWLFASCGLTEIWPAGTTLDQAVAQIEAAAATDEIVFTTDVRETLLERAFHDALRGYLNAETDLGEEHLQALLAAGYNLAAVELQVLRALIAAR